MESIVIDEIITNGCDVRHCTLGNDILTIEFNRIIRAATMEEISDVLLIIFGWSSLVMSKFVGPNHFSGAQWMKITEFEPLRSIDVIRVSENRITLEGRNSTGRDWLKYDFYDAKYRISQFAPIRFSNSKPS